MLHSKCISQAVAYGGHRAVIATECDRELSLMSTKGWADAGLQMACAQARRTSKCLLPVLLPLLKAETERCGGIPAAMSRPAPEALEIHGLPSYALDGYTRPGRTALTALASGSKDLRKLLAHLGGYKRRMDALTSLLFVAEGGVCTSELSDPLYDELKAQSLGCWSGLSKLALADGLAIMRAAIPALNRIRTEVMEDAKWTR